MKETSRRLLTQGKSLGLVPTMGALHGGHLFLFKIAKGENDIVVASIFVNPTQFGPSEDFDKYPKDLESDIMKLESAGADILFVPEVAAMYPEGFSTYIGVRGLSDRLCGAFRPGHFEGVATVVCKFFNLALPTRAYFGQKDFQQAQIIKRMTKDLNLSVECIICATVRENDGLAMSSRNRYLSPEEREAAAVVYNSLKSATHMVKDGVMPTSVTEHMNAMLKAEPLVSEVQYAGVYNPETFEESALPEKKYLLAVAVKMGNTRLIDNMLVEI
jgi:pantoate--beta-alanine ligase